jgi:hypothetical protein
MDRDLRSRIERATQDARRLLEDEFAEQLYATYDIDRNSGAITPLPGEHLGERQRLVRARLVAALQHKVAGGMTAKEAVADFVRDCAFTTLNRFVALKMLEARGLVQQAVSAGEASAGFREFAMLAPGLDVLADGEAWRLYLECLFDELSREVRVLFDRRDAASALWPRRPQLLALLDILNRDELDPVWGEDETIGWVYQYFNSQTERRAIRNTKEGGSQAPRNSRELAVRNQFFTPRYVVEFLADNTLGRTWYEMTGGQTRLKDQCRFLVWRPDEDIRPRPPKDPRDIKVLDPACGSGHFLLYAFDLMAAIYAEAWELDGSALRRDHPDRAAFDRTVPGLILSHNLFGIDIDPRCAQIAALALWMRAQRAFHQAGTARADRPAIRRTNIVVAEPMPGDADLMRDFAEGLQPRVLAWLFQVIHDRMLLAGDLGSLLKIEVALADAIAEARDQWSREQHALPGIGGHPAAHGPDLSGIDAAAFFDRVETLLIDALAAYVKNAQGLTAARRRLFADDAAHALGFLHLMRQKYDVVLMNPPFGACSVKAKKHFERVYESAKADLYAAMVERGVGLLQPRGMLGAITSRTAFFLSSFKKWRRDVILRTGKPQAFIDLGFGVLDAMVETAAYTLERSK